MIAGAILIASGLAVVFGSKWIGVTPWLGFDLIVIGAVLYGAGLGLRALAKKP